MAWPRVHWICEAVIEDCNRALKLEPKLTNAFYNRAYAKSEMGRHQEAIEDYNKSIRLNPRSESAYYNRGLAKFNLGMHKAAVADYGTATWTA